MTVHTMVEASEATVWTVKYVPGAGVPVIKINPSN